MKYKIEVHSMGYEDTSLVVEAPSLRVAKQSERAAKVAWVDHNGLDWDSDIWEMPFTRVTKVSGNEDPRPLALQVL